MQKRIHLSAPVYARCLYLRRTSDGRLLEKGINADKHHILLLYREHLKINEIDLEFSYIHDHIHWILYI